MRTQSICLTAVFVLLCPFASAQWVKTNGLDSGYVTALAVSGSNLFAGAGGVFTSTNSGEAWTNVSLSPTGNQVNVLTCYGTQILAGCGFYVLGNLSPGGAYRSTDNGATWDTIGFAGDVVYDLVMKGSSLFATTLYAGPSLSTDNGKSWTAGNSGLPTNARDKLAVCGEIILAGGGYGVYFSSNNGATWSSANVGLSGSVNDFVLSRTNLYAGTGGAGIFLSTNNGTSWSKANNGLPYDSLYGTYPWINDLAARESNVFVGTTERGVFLSTNNGASWKTVNAGLTNVDVRALVVSDTYLFAGTSGSGVWRRPLSEMITSAEPTTGELPREFVLSQNYPNPFNPSTTIKFELPKASHVSLAVYEILGREVSVLVNDRRDAGVYEVKFDGSRLSSGVYFYRLRAGDYISTKKLLLLK